MGYDFVLYSFGTMICLMLISHGSPNVSTSSDCFIILYPELYMLVFSYNNLNVLLSLAGCQGLIAGGIHFLETED